MADRLRRSSRKRHVSAPQPAPPLPAMPPPAPKHEPMGSSKPPLTEQEGGDERTNASYEGSTLAQQDITSASSPALPRRAELSYIKPSRTRHAADDPAISGVCAQGGPLGLGSAVERDHPEIAAQPRPAESGVMLDVAVNGPEIGTPYASRVEMVGLNKQDPAGASMVAAEDTNVNVHCEPVAVVGGACSSAPHCPAAMTCENDLRAAVEHLVAVEPRLSPLVERHGLPFKLLAKTGASAFQSLCRSVVYQQLNTKVASGIYERVMTACKCVGAASLTPDLVASASAADLRLCGLSERKVSDIQGLASAFSTGVLSERALLLMGEEEMQTALTQLKGIGPWTVHMYQMFVGGRPDCLPTGDLSIRKGLQVFFGLPSAPTPSQMEALTQNWRPYRSVACFYMWRVVPSTGSTGFPPPLFSPCTSPVAAQVGGDLTASKHLHGPATSTQHCAEGNDEHLVAAPSGGDLYRPASALRVACSEGSAGCSNVAVQRKGGQRAAISGVGAYARQASATSAMVAALPGPMSTHRRQAGNHDASLADAGTMIAGNLDGSGTQAEGACVADTGTIVAAATNVASSPLLPNITQWAGQHQNAQAHGVMGAKRRRAGVAGGNSCDSQGRQASGGASTRPRLAPLEH